jgi:hypothetical protein
MRTRGTITAAVGALLALAAAGPSWGQRPPQTTGAAQNAEPAPPPLDRKACANDKRATTGSGDTVQVPQPDKDLSDKLAATDGVICPPVEIDPDMHAPAPGGGAMPVIPPPGSPGGDPSVRPK